MKKILILPLLFVSLFAFQPTAVFACSCIVPMPPVESMEASAAVFAGRVTDIEELSVDSTIGSLTNLSVTFNVSEVWKGPEDATLTIRTADNSAACGYNFEEGKEYLVYAYTNPEDGGLATGLCNRTALLSEANDDLAALGEGNAVEPSEKPTTETDSEDRDMTIGTVPLAAIVIGGVILLILAALAVRKK